MSPTIEMPSSPEATQPTGATDELAPPVIVDAERRRLLLSIARTALAMAIAGPRSHTFDQQLDRACAQAQRLPGSGAAFVTLTIDGALRGCMGSLDPERPLGEAVAVSAALAGTQDPRFRPVRPEELRAIHLEVSVLGPCRPLPDLACFRPGIDGVVVERAGRRGLLLPEVATTFGWGALEMLEAVGEKAGLGRGGWRDSRTRISVFRTARFGGPALETPEPGDG